jgi:hypothetical protein
LVGPRFDGENVAGVFAGDELATPPIVIDRQHRRLGETLVAFPPILNRGTNDLMAVAKNIRLDDARLTDDSFCRITAAIDAGFYCLDDDMPKEIVLSFSSARWFELCRLKHHVAPVSFGSLPEVGRSARAGEIPALERRNIEIITEAGEGSATIPAELPSKLHTLIAFAAFLATTISHVAIFNANYSSARDR